MKRRTMTTAAVALSLALLQTPVAAQDSHPHLHINTRWDECAFQLDPSLTPPRAQRRPRLHARRQGA